MSLNQSMNITLGSLRNNQYALTVVAQNISNIHTEGYVRQRINFETNPYTTDCENVISTIKGMNGASVSSLTDFADDNLFKDLIGKNADAEYYNNLADGLGDLSDISDDLGENGLNAVLSDFFAASANLEKYPADISIRQQFVIAAENVADRFNQLSTRYSSFKDDKLNKIEYNTETLNNLFNKLALANKNYLDTNGSPSAESDINNILKELSNYANVDIQRNQNGTVDLYLGGNAVVSGSKLNYTLKADIDRTSDNAVNFKLVSTEDGFVIDKGVTEAFTSGAMKADLELVNGTGGRFSNVNDLTSSLNKAAEAFANAMNDIQTYDGGDVFAASITTDAATGDLILEKSTHKLFETSDGSSAFDASNIKINDEVYKNPYLVAAARIDLNKYKDEEGAIDPNWVKAIGNSDNAVEFTGLQNKKICTIGDSPVSNATLSDFLLYNSSKNAKEAGDADGNADTFQTIADSAAENYSNLVGVNLDEELANMIKYQRSYEASAKLFSVIDSIMVTIINMV